MLGLFEDLVEMFEVDLDDDIELLEALERENASNLTDNQPYNINQL